MSRRVWFKRDCGLTGDPKVQRLGDRYGGEAVLAFEEMLALAKLETSRRFTTSYATLARRAFLKSPAAAKRIVTACEEFDLMEVERLEGGEFTATPVGRSRWLDPDAAERKQMSRGSHTNVTELRPHEGRD